MSAPTLELADIFRRYGPAYRQAHKVAVPQRRVMWAVETCRTPALGGSVEYCGHCQYSHIRYRSCRNRHCPKCLGEARAKWVDQRAAELLPVEYFHVVFTIPQPLAALVFQNKAALYNILFRAASETLLTIGRDGRHLGADIGFFAVLHSWGQNLHFHPHLHCVVTGGGLSPDGQRWIACRPGFFLPVRVLSRLFRRLFLTALQQAHAAGGLCFFSDLQPLADRHAFAEFLRPLRHSEWVVYSKPPFGSPQQVIAYLGRYTHRVAISNQRLLSMTPAGLVTFQWKDYRHPERPKHMTLEASEFIRRFLQHDLPRGLQRIRYYGFLANSQRKNKLLHCRALLTAPSTQLLPVLPLSPALQNLPQPGMRRCPACQSGILILIPVGPLWDRRAPAARDTS
jgi:hypothetical protein